MADVKKAKELIDLASQPDTVLGWVNREKAIEITATTQIERILGYDPSKGLPSTFETDHLVNMFARRFP